MVEKKIALRVAILVLMIGIVFTSQRLSSMSASTRIEPGRLGAQVNGNWEFNEAGTTSDCVGTAPGSQGNGSYKSIFSLRVKQDGNTITGSGKCSDDQPINLSGTVTGTTIQFRRYGPGCTPGYTVDWNYSGVIQGQIITGIFSGGGDPNDPYAAGCLTIGTFTATKRNIYLSLILGNSQSVNPTPTVTSTLTPTITPTSTPSPTPQPITVTGIVADCRYPYSSSIGIHNAIINYAGNSVTTDEQGRFNLTVSGIDPDPLLDITAADYVPYRERPSRMVEGAFHLIPKDLYRGMYLVIWNPEPSNGQNWHRKWEQQTEFVIVRAGASEQQINAVIALLTSDEYRKMTGYRFTSAVTPAIVDQKPTGGDREGKTVISFAPGIIFGGIAHSEDRNGVIYYAEITWNINQVIDRVIFWHEMVHTVTAGGHINEWPSVVSEVQTTGYVTKTDEQILNCIYNSPPKREKPDF